VAFPASVQAYIDSLQEQGYTDLMFEQFNQKPLRGLIADNTDEYTGSGVITIDPYHGETPDSIDPLVRDALEVDDLFQEAISWMACFGANINSYQALNGLGMGVTFGAGIGVGIGFGAGIGAGIGAGATFGATSRAGVGFGGSAGAGFGFGASAGAGAGFSAGAFAGVGAFGSAGAGARSSANGFVAAGVSASAYSAGALAAAQGDVLFSTGASAVAVAGVDTGFGDPLYGYDSPYGGPGYGKAGYGDYGGLGFGASFGPMGDPGYMAPSNLTLAGVENQSSDLERLLTPKPGFGTGFGGVGAGDSYAGVGGGASVAVGGSISAFAIFAAPGSLIPNGNALTATGRRLGFAPTNPYNVPCLTQSGATGFDLLSLI
jgi:hypothetical protein